jgi:tetratricopeptide (TPR) repeat protein
VLLNELLSLPGETAGALTYHDLRVLALRWFPNSPSLLWTLAEQSFKRQDYESAAEVLRRLLHLGKTGGYDRSHRFDPRILGEDALLNLGATYLQMGKLDEAEACLVQLTASPTAGRQASQYLATAQRRRQQQGGPERGGRQV